MIERILFPKRCPICDEIINGSSLICDECIRIPRRVSEPRCFKCSKHLASGEEEYCGDCLKHSKNFVRGIALYEYDSVKDSINSFKNCSRPEYAEFYAAEIEKYLKDTILGFNADAFVPIPLHPAKFKKRGYNQAQVLAKELSKRFGIPVEDDILKRDKRTKEQKKLSNADREKNVVGAFHMSRNGVKLDNVILVDDVYTTGSTLDEAAGTLKSGGVKNVFFLTLAIGVDD